MRADLYSVPLRNQRVRRLPAAAVLLALFILAPAVQPPARALTPLPSSGVLVPLYEPPGPEWTAVVQAKLANPSLPFLVVVNPHDGPGPVRQPSYVDGIKALKSAGAKVFGYVFTGGGQADISWVESQIDSYRSWYGVSGVFYDGMPNAPGYESYYRALGSYAKGLGLYTIGNPGTALPESYVGILDLYVLDEGPSPPTSLGPYPAARSASIIYGVSTLAGEDVVALSRLTGFVYITNQVGPNPYNALPPYFQQMVSLLASRFHPAPAPGPTVTVASTMEGGGKVAGYRVTVESKGWVVASGFTPLTFKATPGSSYFIEADNYNGSVLGRWSTGATPNTMTYVAPAKSATVTAYYSSGKTVPVTDRSVGPGGVPLVGLPAAVSAHGVADDSGLTPLTFEASAGETYLVQAGDSRPDAVVAWAGGSGNPLTVTPGSEMNLTAVYASTATPPPVTTTVSNTSSTASAEANTTTSRASSTTAPAGTAPPVVPPSDPGPLHFALTVAAVAGVASVLVAALSLLAPERGRLERQQRLDSYC